MTTQSWESADITIRNTISEIVKIYEIETERVCNAYNVLEDAGKNLTAAFGKETSYSSISTLPSRCYSVENSLKEVLQSIKATCWKNLIARLEIRRILSLKRNEELSKKLSNPENLPEITFESVFETFDMLVGSANEFAKEAVKEIYEALHVRRIDASSHDWERKRALKTNQRNATEDLGKKIIIQYTVRPEWGGHGYRIEYGRASDKLTALDKVFHNLDGKPFNMKGYISPLIDAIHTSGPEGIGQTDYFKFKCYGNGNLHIEFTRLDLLKQFNRIANDGTQLKSGTLF